MPDARGGPAAPEITQSCQASARSQGPGGEKAPTCVTAITTGSVDFGQGSGCYLEWFGDGLTEIPGNCPQGLYF